MKVLGYFLELGWWKMSQVSASYFLGGQMTQGPTWPDASPPWIKKSNHAADILLLTYIVDLLLTCAVFSSQCRPPPALLLLVVLVWLPAHATGKLLTSLFYEFLRVILSFVPAATGRCTCLCLYYCFHIQNIYSAWACGCVRQACRNSPQDFESVISEGGRCGWVCRVNKHSTKHCHSLHTSFALTSDCSFPLCVWRFISSGFTAVIFVPFSLLSCPPALTPHWPETFFVRVYFTYNIRLLWVHWKSWISL